jgi:tubulin---tyrosine ligase
MKVYIFREGYMRTSSSHYSLNSDKCGDLNIHLTNNAVQKYGNDYGKYEHGNQLSF